ncbi:MAG TPA: hypothetical protein VGG11_02655 [Xanthobacteraceae bacterium]|jgi:hypothetical protein
MAEREQERENRVQNNKDQRRRTEKYRPVDRHQAMIEIGPETLSEAERLDLALPEPHDVGFVVFLGPRGFCQSDSNLSRSAV